MTRRHRSRAELTILTALLVCAAIALDWFGLAWRLDNLVYDELLKLNIQPSDDDIVIIAIDEASLAALGRWPWPRRLHAEAIRILDQSGAKAVGLNVILAEADFQDPEGDDLLAARMRAYGRVVLPVLPESTAAAGLLRETQPIPVLAASAAALGHIDLEIEPDGIVRYAFLRGGVNAPRWPHFALALQQVAEGGTAAHPSYTPPLGTGSWVRGDHVGIPFAGPPGHFKRVSYIDMLSGETDQDALRDRIALIGVTASGLGHPVPTPQSGERMGMPGVEVIANILAAERSGRFIRTLPVWLGLLLSGAIAMLPALLFPLLPTHRVLPVAIALLALPLAVSALLLWEARLWFAPMSALLVLAASYPLWSWRALRGLAASLDRERSQAETTLRTLTESVIIADVVGTVQYLNPAAEQLTEWDKKTACGRPWQEVLELMDERDGSPIRTLLPDRHGNGTTFDLPRYCSLTTRKGFARQVRSSVAPMASATTTGGAVITLSDVTEERRLAQQMAYQATHDRLTGLPNRVLLQDRLRQALARAERGKTGLGLLFADLDDFKRINDSLGHAAGDLLLHDVGIRFQSALREEDSVARIGGDEFVAIIERLADESEVTEIALKLIECMRGPFRVEGHDTIIGVSIGICVYPRDGADIETMLRHADIAMYRAKEQGGNGFQYFRPAMNRQAQARFTLGNDLQRALSLDQLRLHYQPIIDLESGRIVGAEALLRWQHPSRGLVPPIEFIHIAERSGLIVPIGNWVLRTACSTLQGWQQTAAGPLRMAVNLSPRQFHEPGLAEQMAAILQETGMPPGLLEIEITEDLLMSDKEPATGNLQSLADMGVAIAIDDFGVGYSSLGYLRRFPVDRLKIDRAFVHDILDNADGAAIVRAIAALGQSLRLHLTAEGIELPAQVDFFRELGVEEAQGFLFHRPIDHAAFEMLLAS